MHEIKNNLETMRDKPHTRQGKAMAQGKQPVSMFLMPLPSYLFIINVLHYFIVCCLMLLVKFYGSPATSTTTTSRREQLNV